MQLKAGVDGSACSDSVNDYHIEPVGDARLVGRRRLAAAILVVCEFVA